MPPPRPADWRARLEAGAVLATGLLHFAAEELLAAKAPFIAAASLGWGAYVLRRALRHPAVLAEWGLALKGNLRAARRGGWVFAAGALLLTLQGLLRATLRAPPGLFFVLALYPFWGLVQQFLLQAMLARNLRAWLGSPLRTTLVAAPLFAAAHLPDLLLAAGTFLLALGFTPCYLRDRRLLPLGVYHGWLGALAYYWLLGRDPWAELWG